MDEGGAPKGPVVRSYVPTRTSNRHVSAGRASVLFYRRGGYSVVTASGARHVDRRVFEPPYAACEVVLGRFVSTLRVELPALGGTASFRADVEVQWTVIDPHLVAVREVTDVAEQLAGPLHERLRAVTSSYRSSEWDQAERAAIRECEGAHWDDLGSELGLALKIFIRMRAETEHDEMRRALREEQFSAERARVHEQRLRAARIDAEGHRIHNLLAVDPANTRELLETLKTLRHEDRQDHKVLVDRLREMIESGRISRDDVAALTGSGQLLTPPDGGAGAGNDTAEPRRLVAELAEQTSPGREVPLHVQIVRGGGPDAHGTQLRPFRLPPGGARVLVTVHAPGLVAVDELQQELHVAPGQDSDVLRFRLKAPAPGLHRVTVRAFRGGSFLGEVACQISVEHGGVTRDGPQRQEPLPSMAFDPGEITLQVLKDDAAGTFSFQLIGETFHAPEIYRFRAGDPRQATEQIYAELRRAAKSAATAGGGGDTSRLRDRLRNHGVQLWTSAVPQVVQRQFWDEADNVTAFTVLGEHDVIPWELLYPLNEGRDDRGFLAEWLPVVRRVFGQDRVRSLSLPGVAFVVPPGSPADAGQEVTSLRARLGPHVADAGVLSERAALTALIEAGHAGLLHFACHNSFTGAGSCVAMADGPFDPVDLSSAAQLRSLRPHRPLVFFNACRSAGEIDWFGESLGWAPQFLTAGAGAFVGTLWPVRSRSALQFAEAFYDQLIGQGRTLGQASLAARQTVRDLHGGDPTWLAYAVYGSPAATAQTTA